MVDHLPHVYTAFREHYPEVARALDGMGGATDRASALDGRTVRLVTLGIAVGSLAEGAVRSNVRKALDEGVSHDEIRSVMLHAITTRGFPATVAAWQWMEEVVEHE